MMVPEMQRQVVAAILKSRPDIKIIADPFLGSGTIMVQALLAGKCFIGQDINPLALLISKTRAYCLNPNRLKDVVKRVLEEVTFDSSYAYERSFFNQAKWFTRGASIGLSRLHRAIVKQKDLNSRRFLWTCLAETIRNKSNSRTSTFKLHVRPIDERTTQAHEVINFFFEVAKKNIEKVKDFSDSLAQNNLIDEDFCYKKSIQITFGDSSYSLPSISGEQLEYDLVMTSPPYGDNRTTVPYGQAAWLPLQWIDLKDIDPSIPSSIIERMYEIDNRSLGGRRKAKRKDFVDLVAQIKKCGNHAEKTINALSMQNNDGLSRFVHFIADLSRMIKLLSSKCKPGAYLVWTLGNRTISKIDCPLTDIVADVFKLCRTEEIARIHRRIQSKRIPSKNNVSKTIDEEYTLILQSIPL